MAKTFFTADTHFNHANVLKYCARPFSSIDEMNRELIARWNTVVGPEDTVYHLDDFAMGKPSEWPGFLRLLNGARRILIRGNHDRSARQMLEGGVNEVTPQPSPTVEAIKTRPETAGFFLALGLKRHKVKGGPKWPKPPSDARTPRTRSPSRKPRRRSARAARRRT